MALELSNPDWTIFHSVQQVMQLSQMGTRQDKIRRIWEPTYTCVFKMNFIYQSFRITQQISLVLSIN